MKLFKFYAGTTISLMLLALTIALLVRYQAYLGYVGAGVVILVVIVTGLGVWSVVEKILHRRTQRVEIRRRWELDEEAQSLAEQREQDRLELEQQRAKAEALRAHGDYLKAQAEAQAMQISIEQYRAAMNAGLHYPGPHGSPVHISMDPVTGQTQIRSTDYRALLPERAGTVSNQQATPPPSVEEDRVPSAPSFRSMWHLLNGEELPLCWTINGPLYGTVLDLLSMAVTGKPGRGKTTALMYYVAILLSCGAEVTIWDPHGVMGELAILNGRVLPNMPETARVYYYDRKEDIIASLPGLEDDLTERDELCRPPNRQIKHPHLLLADELPLLAEYDEELKAKAKRNRDEDTLTLIRTIKRFVLEARKWNCYFIGSGQSMDAEILPTRVTENLASRIVFFSSDRRARMAGLENDAIKRYLPIIRRAGSGVMVFDCARFDEPVLGAIPMITIQDLMEFLGLTAGSAYQEEMEPLAPNPLRDRRNVYGTSGTPLYIEAEAEIGDDRDAQNGAFRDDSGAFSGVPSNVRTFPFSQPQQPVAQADTTPEGRPKDYRLNETEIGQFLAAYRVSGNVDRALTAIGKGTRFRQHAREVLTAHNARQA